MIQEVRDMEIRGKQSNDIIEPFIVYHHVTNTCTSIESNSRFRSRGSVGVIELNSMSQYSIHSFIYFIHSLLLHSFVLLSSQSFIFIIVLINYLISTLHNILFMFGFALLAVSTSTTS